MHAWYSVRTHRLRSHKESGLIDEHRKIWYVDINGEEMLATELSYDVNDCVSEDSIYLGEYYGVVKRTVSASDIPIE